PAGQEVVYAVGRAAAERLPDVDVVVGFVDVCGPRAQDVLTEHPEAVVVPYLLTSGYHVRFDIPEAIRGADNGAVATRALGVTPEVIDVLLDRLHERLVADRGVSGPADVADAAGAADGDDPKGALDAVLLTAAGSSDARARQEVLCTGAVLAACSGMPVRVGFMTGPGPSARDVLEDLRAQGAERVAAVSYLLAPGFFHSRAAGLGAQLTTEPLGVHPRMVDAVVSRYLAQMSAA
ncbi:MAG: CbiX/SirB N-terminal domain-containing protein, partial [Ornithinimicrobium sp.]